MSTTGRSGGTTTSRLIAPARWAFVLIAAAALWSTLRHAELGRAASLAAGLGAHIALVPLPFLLAMSLQAAGYARILAVLDGGRSTRAGLRARAAHLARLTSVLVSAEAVLMSLPAGAAVAESLNPYLLARRCGVPITQGLAGVAAKKALIVLANALYMFIAVALGARHLEAASRGLLGVGGLAWAVAAAGIGVLVAGLGMSRVIFSGSMAARSHGLLRRLPSARLRAFLDERKAGFVETDAHFAELLGRGLPALAGALGLMLGCWLAEGAETFLLMRLLDVRITFSEVLAFEVVVVLLRSLAFMVPAGLGVQDAGYVAFLAAFGVADAATVGVAFLLLKRSKELFYIAVGYLLFLVLGDRPKDEAGA